jgi:ankyrin repeat protein
MLKLLINYGSSLGDNLENYIIPSLLHIACVQDNLDIAGFLLENHTFENCFINSMTPYTSPLDYACYFNSTNVLPLLIDNQTTALNLQNGAITPLMLACYRGNLTAVTMLCYSCQSVTTENIDWDTALSIARENSHQDIVDYLQNKVEKSGCPSLQDDNDDDCSYASCPQPKCPQMQRPILY